MKRTAILLLACTAFGCVCDATAQSLSRGWDSYRQQQKQQQAGAQGGTAPVAAPSSTSQAATAATSVAASQADNGFTTVTTDAPEVPATVAPAPAPSYTQTEASRIDSGAFIGVQGGRGEVFDGYKQDMLGFNAGYRWRAGSVTLIGLEASAGRLDRTGNADDVFVPAVRFAGLGGTARFNFGDSPLFAVVRVGSWYADVKDMSEEIYGGYAGLGLGVDLGRYASLSVMYTNYIYAKDYYDYSEDITINRAEVLNIGAEVRF
ncbi:hypothetical protein [Xanthomonas sp. 3058]|uniref:hypothetical protein n=1 Tax=Xanthomonas sp. 3058 TaxID=3035314 RepID=UPI001617A30A|nr:hypothetical protein [Xanthomonas sp. 3058]